jgi:glutamate-5-semialdehyde dehydrogenase
METLLVDKAIAPDFLHNITSQLFSKNVEIRADGASLELLQAGASNLKLKPVDEEDYYKEYNDYIMNLRLVNGVEEAVNHINRYGSSHSDSIVTKSESTAQKFLSAVDSAAVYWNASTRFTDGGEFGMGAEIGISTDKVGARGPMGLEELTSYKWIGIGSGQIRT